MRRRNLAAVLASVVACTLAPRAVRAAGVVGTGTPGSCSEAALNAALAGGGSVTFNCGGGVVTIPITSQKVIAAATTVDGAGNQIVLDAGGVTRHFTTSQNIALTLRNLTLRNGRCPVPDPGQPTPGFGGSIRSGILSPLTVTDSRFESNVCDTAGNDVGGGAIRQRRGVLVVQRTVFTGNRGGNGGALNISDAPTTVEDSTFTSNTTNANAGSFSGVGGAIYVDGSGGGAITIRRSVITGNSSTAHAGGVHTFHYPPDQGLVIEDSTISGNATVQNGGGVFHQAGPLTIARSTLAGNVTVGQGGGLYVVDASPTAITNTTFSANRANGTNPTSGATGNGGAILAYGFAGTVSGTLSHVTIAENHAGWVGGGIAGAGSLALTLRGSIVALNTSGHPTGIAENCSVQLGNGGFNLQTPAAGGSGFDPNCTASPLIANPLLGPLASNGGPTQTRSISSASPARNLVTSGCPPPATDQRGVARPQAGACDAGAYEASGLVSIGGATVTEGDAGTVNAIFPVTLSEPLALTATVSFTTANGTAIAGFDFTATSGTVTFPAGQTSRTITVPVLGDTLDEDNETFPVTLTSASNAVIGTAQATGTITDDDNPPTLAAGDCVAPEGTGGASFCSVAVALSTASGKTVTVSFGTVDGTATAGSDYTAVSGVLTFPPGALAANVVVPVTADAVDEVDETLSLILFGPANASLGDAQGLGFIDDDDGPSVRIGDAAVTEGNAGSTAATFAVQLSQASVQPVVVGFATGDGTAVAGADYAAAAGSVTFPPGMTSRTVSVNVIGDTADEPDEVFFVSLSAPQDASVGDGSGAGRIVDDDGGLIRLRELSDGSSLVDDLAGGADVFLVTQPARSSWEVVVDGTSGDIGGASGVGLERLGSDLSSVVQSAVAVGSGPSRTLRWQNTTDSTRLHYVRVRSTQCTTGCGPDDRYRVRAYDTTGSLPRFNCSGQTSVVTAQNRTASARSGTVLFWNGAGTLLGSSPISLPARGSAVVGACGVAGVAGQSGTATLMHDGSLGDVEAKAVALDPASGFSFDTPMNRPRR